MNFDMAIFKAREQSRHLYEYTRQELFGANSKGMNTVDATFSTKNRMGWSCCLKICV